MNIFSSLFSYLTYPWVLIGLLLLFGYVVFKYLLKLNVIKQLPEQFDTGVPKMLVNYGYIFCIAVILLGLVLKQNQLNEAEQTHALKLLHGEYEANLTVMRKLSQNVFEVHQAHQKVVAILHSDGSKILSILFPQLNKHQKAETNISKQVTASFEALNAMNLLKNKSQMTAFNAIKGEIKKLLNLQLKLLNERQDKAGGLYLIEDVIWQNFREILDDVNDFNVLTYQTNLQQMNSLLNKYRNTLKQTEEFFIEVSNFTNRNTFLSNGDVYEILIKEERSEKALTEILKHIQSELKVFQLAKPEFSIN